jgi:hypothetical protein
MKGERVTRNVLVRNALRKGGLNMSTSLHFNIKPETRSFNAGMPNSVMILPL